MIDWAARQDVPGAGVSLMKYVGRFTDVLLSVGGSTQTRAILPFLGFQPYGEATGYVRTLRPVQIFKDRSRPHWRLVARFARAGVWAAMAPRFHASHWQVDLVAAGTLGSLETCLPAPNGPSAVFERTGAMFRYALACPIAPMELYSLKQGGIAKGYFLIAFAPAQARLVDWWITSNDPADCSALLQHAVQMARRRSGTAELVTLASDKVVSQALLESGFHARRTDPIQVLPVNRTSNLPQKLRVQMLDSDAAYHHTGRPTLWA